MNRPNFKDIETFQEFCKYYWYREELKQICKKIGTDYSGTKKELTHNIEEYFKGNIIERKRTSKAKSSIERVTLDTGLLECGFCFSRRFRDFFKEVTGIDNFKFNADMVATAKKVRLDGDTSFTLRDMLDVYYGIKEYAKYDNSSCEWNRFLKDFCADKNNANCPNKLKVASILWKEVRESPREKVYTKELLKEYADKISDVL